MVALKNSTLLNVDAMQVTIEKEHLQREGLYDPVVIGILKNL